MSTVRLVATVIVLGPLIVADLAWGLCKESRKSGLTWVWLAFHMWFAALCTLCAVR